MANENILARLIPGGIQPTDHVHVVFNDGTCSRCREHPPEHDVGIQMWSQDGRRMWIYCEACLGGTEPARKVANG